MEELKGKVKQVLTYEDEQLIRFEYYDQNGKRIRYATFKNGVQTCDQCYIDSENLELELLQSRNYDEQGVFKYQYNFYEQEGRCLKWEILNVQGQLNCFEENHYDDRGNLIQQFKHPDTGTIRYDFIYDAQNRKIQKQKFTSASVLLKTQRWKYDSNGNPIEYKKFDREGTLVKFQRLIYNAENQKVKSYLFEAPQGENYYRHTDFAKDATIFKTIFEEMQVFKINSEGKEIERELDLAFFSHIITYQYDERGNRIEKTLHRYRSDYTPQGLTTWNQDIWKYDDHNELIFESELEMHTDWENYFEYHFKNTYNAQAKLITKSHHSGDEKKAYRIEKFTYDQQRNLRRYENEAHGKKEIERYDEQGNTIYQENDRETIRYEIEYYE
ncbi:MAG: hypothetical protein AB8G15_13035 [Saprospiraceae bacterium]